MNGEAMAPHIRAFACLLAMGGVLLFGSAACSISAAADGDEPTSNPNGADLGGDCDVGFDCKSGVCSGGKCALSSLAGGDQTDVGCGGASAPKCEDGKKCKAAGDCASGVCTSGTCAAPSPTDGVKNGAETDTDCGGGTAPDCAVGKGCDENADCASDACSYAKKCVEYKSCTGHFGGDTCGAGETGTAEAKHESCCTTVDVTDRPAGKLRVDKYQVTAGRMRAFIERYSGNLQEWAKTSPQGWNDAWTSKLPASISDAHFLLGPANKRGCAVAGQGGRTYWQPPIGGNAAEQSDFAKDVLDEKALNCVTWHMAQALCVSDGGRLATAAEIKWLFENGGKTQWPWQTKDTSAFNPNAGDGRLAHYYSYQTPNPPKTMRTAGSGSSTYPVDQAFWMAPPGRHPSGANQYGIEDMAGNMMPWVNEGPRQFIWTLSWEKHAKNLTATTYNPQDPPGAEAYYAIGARCVRDL